MKTLLLFLWSLLLVILPVRAQWQAIHGYSSAQYQNTFNQLTSQGYRLTWVSGYTINNVPAYAAIFEKESSPGWVAHHGMTASAYQNYFNQYTSQGYRLALVNGYAVNGVDYYVGIWDKSPSGPWVAKHRMTSSDYQTAFDSYASQGYRLMHVSGYSIGNTAYYAAIWQQVPNTPAWVARHGMTSDQYQSAFNVYVSQGYRLVLVNGYQVNNVDYYAAIWDKSSSGQWKARHGMTSSDYQTEFNNDGSQGYKLMLVSGYDQGTSDRYAGLWVKE